MTPLEAVSGVGPRIAKVLRSQGITTADLLAEQDTYELLNSTRLTEGTCRKLIRNARGMINRYTMRTGGEVEEETAKRPVLTTGIGWLNRCLLGGIESGSIVEFFGPARSGKTQLCHQLAVTAQLPIEHGGLGGKVLWLDTSSSFRSMLIRANAQRFGIDPNAALDSVSVQQVIDIDHIQELFHTVPSKCAEEDYRVVVIDSLGGLFMLDYLRLAQVGPGRYEFAKLAKMVRSLVRATGAIVVYTNQVVEKIGIYGDNPNAPMGGHIVSHFPDYRFYIRRKMNDVRVIQLMDHASLPESQGEAYLGWGGLYDYPESKRESESAIVLSMFHDDMADGRPGLRSICEEA